MFEFVLVKSRFMCQQLPQNLRFCRRHPPEGTTDDHESLVAEETYAQALDTLSG